VRHLRRPRGAQWNGVPRATAARGSRTSQVPVGGAPDGASRAAASAALLYNHRVGRTGSTRRHRSLSHAGARVRRSVTGAPTGVTHIVVGHGPPPETGEPGAPPFE